MAVYHLRILLVCLAALSNLARSAQAEYTTLVLQTRRQVGWEAQRAKQVTGLLSRELARQALLVAARDEVGLLTRDQTLREIGVGDDDELQLLLTVEVQLDGKCEILIKQILDDEAKEVWTKSIKFKADSKNTYLTLTPQFEAFSRGEFVDLLHELGATTSDAERVSPADGTQAEELQEIDQLLEEVDLVSQFLAMRRLHKTILTSGETPELLGRLVNGYANLGLLTECTWSADSLAFKARSMLYAQRLREKFGDYLFGRWHWAYAQAMAGIHFTALDQLKNPLPEQAAGSELPSLPGWGEVIDPYSRYDNEALESLAESGNRWARYLRLWSLYTAGEQRQIDLTAETSMQECPEAFNVYTLLGDKGSIGIMHIAGRASVQAMMQTCAVRWSASRDLPPAVRQAALTPPTQQSPLAAWGKVIDSLRQADNQHDLSWHMLANLLEDTAAMVAAANLRMARSSAQEHSLEPYVEMFLPAIKDHPHIGYFLARKPPRGTRIDEVVEACKPLRFEDPSLWIGRDTSYVWGFKNSRGERIGYDAYYGASRNFTAISLVLMSNRPNQEDKYTKMYVEELRKVSPHSPMALVNEIQFRRKKPADIKPDEINKWKELAGASANAWRELGQLHVARKEYEDSYLCFEKSFGLSPASATAREWAWAYEWAKEFDKVVPTFERYLEMQDFGLGHSNTHYEIARFYLRRDKAEEAKPHALESAESWSARGLRIAATVCEKLELKDEADQWYRKLSEAYPSNAGMEWYLWRRRSGNSDVNEARELAQRYLGVQELQECTATGWWPLVYYLFESDRGQSLKLARKRIKEEPGLYSESHLLCLAVEYEIPQFIDQSFERMKDMVLPGDSGEAKWIRRYVESVSAIVEAESVDAIPIERMDKLLKDNDTKMGWCDESYFFSKLLQLKGFEEQAKRYRDLAISFQDTSRITWYLAVYDANQLEADEDSQ